MLVTQLLFPLIASVVVLVPSGLAENFQTVIDTETISQSDKSVQRIAIVGAGAAGSSAAYHLSKFAEELAPDAVIEIDIFETSSHVGGRTTTVNALNDPRYPVELGASIFVEINQILFNASRDFNLLTNEKIFESTGADYDLGIWDGDAFVFATSSSSEDGSLMDRLSGWWDIAKMLWKYGFSPIRLRSLQQSTIGRFLKMYDELFPFADLTQVAEDADLLSVTGATGETVLAQASISEQFAREIIQASTRVNYAQNLQDFHGLETLVCMSTDGAMSVEGGNWLIFDRMIKSSGARLRLNSTVTSIETGSDTSSITFTSADGTQIEDFDTVILAHPYNATLLTLSPKPKHTPHKGVDYVQLHVTLFTTPFRPSPQYFNLDPLADSAVPNAILTTIPEALDPDFLGRGIEGVGPTGFWSLSTLRILRPSTDGYIPGVVSSGTIPPESLALAAPQYLYKIFSPAPMTAEDLIEIFGWHNHPELPTHLDTSASSFPKKKQQKTETETLVSSLPTSLVTWSHEKMWYSYPYLPPRTKFDCFDIYNCPPVDIPVDSPANKDKGNNEDDKPRLTGRLWYTNAIEPFISTMETSALSGRNIARLIVDGLDS